LLLLLLLTELLFFFLFSPDKPLKPLTVSFKDVSKGLSHYLVAAAVAVAIGDGNLDGSATVKTAVIGRVGRDKLKMPGMSERRP
jgi:hypothetical protein